MYINKFLSALGHQVDVELSISEQMHLTPFSMQEQQYAHTKLQWIITNRPACFLINRREHNIYYTQMDSQQTLGRQPRYTTPFLMCRSVLYSIIDFKFCKHRTFSTITLSLLCTISTRHGGVNRVVDRDVLRQSKLVGYGYYTSTTTCGRGDLQDRTCALLFNKKQFTKTSQRLRESHQVQTRQPKASKELLLTLLIVFTNLILSCSSRAAFI